MPTGRKNFKEISCKENLAELGSGSCLPLCVNRLDFPIPSDHSKSRLEFVDNEPLGNVSSLRLRGGGDNESEIEDDDSAYEMDIDDMMPEDKLRNTLLEAGYTMEEINVIIASKEETLEDSPQHNNL